MGVKTRKLGNIDTQIIEWQSVFTGDGSTGLTAVSGRGYFIDTTSGTGEVTLPSTVSSNVGDKIAIKDFARTFGTNAVSIASNLFDGVHNTPSFSTNGQSISCLNQAFDVCCLNSENLQIADFFGLLDEIRRRN